MATTMRFSIGDRIMANCFTDHNFAVKVEISAISNIDYAEYQKTDKASIILRMFNSDNAEELFQSYQTDLYYICRVLEPTEDFNIDDYIVLNDKLIREEGTYYLNQEISLYLNVSFSTITNYRTSEDLIEDIKYYLSTKGVDEVSVYEELSYEEKLETELNEYRSIITSLKSLRTISQTVDSLHTVLQTMIAKVQSLLNILNK